jgi:pimeloyl-ACP methyl ester carboxylesterase
MRVPNQKTFVLVPGAWLGAWAWRRVVPLLERAGSAAYPLTLTGMGDRVHLATSQVGIETAIQDVVNAIVYEGLDDVVLVGHSFAGKVVAAVADRIPERIGTLLFLDAIRPAKVRTPQGGIADWPQKDREDLLEEVKRRGDGWKFLISDEMMNTIGYDIVGKDRDWFLSKTTPWPLGMVQDPVTLSEKYDVVRKAYVFCTRGGDNVEEIMKEKLDGEYRVLESGHWPMITKPAELVQAMLELV